MRILKRFLLLLLTLSLLLPALFSCRKEEEEIPAAGSPLSYPITAERADSKKIIVGDVIYKRLPYEDIELYLNEKKPGVIKESFWTSSFTKKWSNVFECDEEKRYIKLGRYHSDVHTFEYIWYCREDLYEQTVKTIESAEYNHFCFTAFDDTDPNNKDRLVLIPDEMRKVVIDILRDETTISSKREWYDYGAELRAAQIRECDASGLLVGEYVTVYSNKDKKPICFLKCNDVYYKAPESACPLLHELRDWVDESTVYVSEARQTESEEVSE